MSTATEVVKAKDLSMALDEISTEDDSMYISGGATVVALLNANLVNPAKLVSLKNVNELRGIKKTPNGRVQIGSMTHHSQTAASTILCGSLSGVREAASKIANPVVRNMGTIGGSIAFADPGADYPPALVAADAEVEITSKKGDRLIKAEEFFVDWYETALNPGELIKNIYLPKVDKNACGVHEKFARVEGDYATASINLILKMERHVCSSIRVAVGACGPTPVRMPEAENSLVGEKLTEDNLFELGEQLAAVCDPVDDVRGSASYRLKLVPNLLIRAVQRAQEYLLKT